MMEVGDGEECGGDAAARAGARDGAGCDGGRGDPGGDVAAAAALNVPARRRLYEAVRRAVSPMSRDDAAAATGLTRATTTFHLERLVQAGLLDAGFARYPGRAGGGAGRPAKLYRDSGRGVSVTIPVRRYAFLGSLLAGAVTDAEGSGGDPRAAARRRARRAGADIASSAAEAAAARGGGGGAGEAREVLCSCLEELGFEPVEAGPDVLLRNCPFHALAAEHRGLVCAVGAELVAGLVEGAGVRGYRAEPGSADDACCVLLRGVPAARTP